jgi:hypothetical protein
LQCQHCLCFNTYLMYFYIMKFTFRRVFDLKLFSWVYVQHPHVSLCQITRRQVTSTQPCSIDVSTVPWRYSVGTKLLRKLWTNNETGTYCIWFKYRIYIYMYIVYICNISIYINRQTASQPGRQTARQTDRHSDRQREREIDR